MGGGEAEKMVLCCSRRSPVGTDHLDDRKSIPVNRNKLVITPVFAVPAGTGSESLSGKVNTDTKAPKQILLRCLYYCGTLDVF